jgi:hypothetical protein
MCRSSVCTPSDIPGVNPATNDRMILYYCLMTKVDRSQAIIQYFSGRVVTVCNLLCPFLFQIIPLKLLFLNSSLLHGTFGKHVMTTVSRDNIGLLFRCTGQQRLTCRLISRQWRKFHILSNSHYNPLIQKLITHHIQIQ